MEEIKKPTEREQIRTNIRTDEDTYIKLKKYKEKTKYSLNTIMKMSFDNFINFHQY